MRLPLSHRYTDQVRIQATGFSCFLRTNPYLAHSQAPGTSPLDLLTTPGSCHQTFPLAWPPQSWGEKLACHIPDFYWARWHSLLGSQQEVFFHDNACSLEEYCQDQGISYPQSTHPILSRETPSFCPNESKSRIGYFFNEDLLKKDLTVATDLEQDHSNSCNILRHQAGDSSPTSTNHHILHHHH